jgi:phospholipase/carboxylesterase
MDAPTLVLFHGTGGTERDLIPLAKRIDPDASLLGLRGNVLEGEMSRFFRRLAEGVFDEEDLLVRTGEVKEYLDKAAQDYGRNRANMVAVGYSNGANMAASLLFHYGHALRGALLFHPMVPRRGIDLPDLKGVPVFIAAGIRDPICPPEETAELEQLLQGAGASVTTYWGEGGHRLTAAEADQAAAWYRQTFCPGGTPCHTDAENSPQK